VVIVVVVVVVVVNAIPYIVTHTRGGGDLGHDRWGRKKTLMTGIAGGAVSVIIFGTARTYAQALIGRMMSGE